MTSMRATGNVVENSNPLPALLSLGDLVIGHVYRIENGPERGRWHWSMIADLSVPRFRDRGGTASTCD